MVNIDAWQLVVMTVSCASSPKLFKLLRDAHLLCVGPKLPLKVTWFRANWHCNRKDSATIMNGSVRELHCAVRKLFYKITYSNHFSDDGMCANGSASPRMYGGRPATSPSAFL